MIKKIFKLYFIYLFVTRWCYTTSDSYLDMAEYHMAKKNGEKDAKMEYVFIWKEIIERYKRICEIIFGLGA